MEARHAPSAEQSPAGQAQRIGLIGLETQAVVHLHGVPSELLDTLPELYSSAFSTVEYFTVYDHPRHTHVCELVQPRHVLAFTARGATVDVLNKVIDIEPEAMRRLAAAIFAARPATRRIRAEVKYPPRELRVPVRETYRSDDQVIALPPSRLLNKRALRRVSCSQEPWRDG